MRNMECEAFIIHLQGLTKDFRYIITYGEKMFEVHFNDETISNIIKSLCIFEVY